MRNLLISNAAIWVRFLIRAQTNLNVLTGLTSQLDATTQALSRAQQDKSFTESMLAQQLATWQATQATQTGRILTRSSYN